MRERFQQLFTGGEHAHGVWDKETGDCSTVKSPATAQDYEDHLAGVKGLGVVPVTTEGNCRFAAIDIDVDNINHQALLEKAKKRRMPLSVCRSKSGGAHLYLFCKEPLRAALVIQTLKRWAGALGYPKSEIFPKQPKVTRTNLGNWINLPYFDQDRTVRYAMGPDGALTLEQFLDSVQPWEGRDEADGNLELNILEAGKMPPCLATLSVEGLPEGQRNSGLFDFAIYYRKSSPNGWEDRVLQANQQFVHPPLPNREVQSIIKSVSGRKYQYKCDEEPICSRCDRKTCLTLPFGVGHEPWKDGANYHDLLMSNFRKILTDPPVYLVEINGHDVKLTSEELMQPRRFKTRMFELLNLTLPMEKQERWDMRLRELSEKVIELEAPPEASAEGMLMLRINEWLCSFELSRSRDDILKGRPWADNARVYFRAYDLLRHLNTDRGDRCPPQELFQILKARGCQHAQLKIKGKNTMVWDMPLDRLSYQTEELDRAKFAGPMEEM